MNLKEDIKPVSYVKSHIADILSSINDTHRPVIITQNGEAKGVFIDTETYANLNNALSLMKLMTQSEKQIQSRQTKSNNKVFGDLEKKLLKKK